MSERDVLDQTEPSGGAPQAACASRPSRVCCPLQGRWGVLLWALLIGAIVFIQWPMLKGVYHRATRAEAPASAVAWRTGFPAALAESAKTGKPVLLDFTASWCPTCQVMKHDIWPDGRVAAAVNGGYVPVLVDVDDPQNAEVGRRYGLRGIPLVLIVDAQGWVLKQGAYMSAGGMLDFLKPSARPTRTGPPLAASGRHPVAAPMRDRRAVAGDLARGNLDLDQTLPARS